MVAMYPALTLSLKTFNFILFVTADLQTKFNVMWNVFIPDFTHI